MRKDSQLDARRFAGIALLALAAGNLIAPTNAFAGKNDIKRLQRQKTATERALREAERAQREKERWLDDAKEGAYDDQLLRGDCETSCRPASSAQCTAQDFEREPFRIRPEQYNAPVPRGNAMPCVLLFTAWKGLGRPIQNLDADLGACASAVRGCGVVNKELRIVEAEAEYASLEARVRRFEGELDDLDYDIQAEFEDCPTCGAAMGGVYGSASMGAMGAMGGMGYGYMMQEPSTWDRIIQGIQAFTPLALGGINAYMGIRAMNTQLDAYQMQLNNCATLGIPCPSFGMGGGLAMGGGMMGNPFGGMMGGGPFGGMMGSPFGGMMGGGPFGGMMGGAFGGMMGNPFGGMMNPYGGAFGGMMGNPFGGMMGGMMNPYAGAFGGMNPYAGAFGGMMGSPFGGPMGGMMGGMMNPYAGAFGGMMGMYGNPFGGMMGSPMGGMMGNPFGGAGGAFTGGAQSTAMMQAAMQTQMLQMLRAQQSQQDLMLVQQQMWEAQARYQQSMQQIYGGGMYGGMYGGMSGGLSGGIGLSGGFQFGL